MKKKFKLGVIGGGFMAHAIVAGVIESRFIREKKIIVSGKNYSDFEKFEEFEIETTLDNREVAENSEYLLLCVKPQNFTEVAADLKGVNPEKVISIMAGISRYKIRKSLGGFSKVCRCMPNLPCSIGVGAVAADYSDFSELDDIQFISGLFDSIGIFMSVSEDKLDAVTGISGSGPAYVYMFINSLIQAGIKNGLEENEAETLVLQTLIGGVEMVRERKDVSIQRLIQSVCSKGGTTIEAIKSFEKDDFSGCIERAVDACVKRSKELSKE